MVQTFSFFCFLHLNLLKGRREKHLCSGCNSSFRMFYDQWLATTLQYVFFKLHLKIIFLNLSDFRSVLSWDPVWGDRTVSRKYPRKTRCNNVCERTEAQSNQVYQMLSFCVSSIIFVVDVWMLKYVNFPSGFLWVLRGWQRDFRKNLKTGENVPCWFIHNNGTGLIDGDMKDYIVSGLFKNQ